MICTRCGNAEADDAVYCSNCGASFTPQMPSPGEAAGPEPITLETAAAPAQGAGRLAPPPNDPYQEGYEHAEAARSPGQAQPDLTSPKGFVASLFDFGFNSFVTPKVVKVLYVLIMIMIGLSALVFLLFAFRVNALFGILSLVILCPLYFFVYLALWRIVLEIFVVVFRIADDLRYIRSRGDLR